MNTCRTCEHWDASGQKAGGICGCEKLREPYWKPGPKQPDELVYSYNEGGAFWTGPDFGCVHHSDLPTGEPTYGQLKIRLEQARETIESQRLMLLECKR